MLSKTEMTSNDIDNVIRSRAVLTLSRRQLSALLCKPQDAIVSYPEFNPFRAVQPLALVTFPLFVNHRYFELQFSVFEHESTLSL